MSVEINQQEIETVLQRQAVDSTFDLRMRDTVTAEEGIRQGLEDVAHGRTRPAREALDEFRQKHGIPR